MDRPEDKIADKRNALAAMRAKHKQEADALVREIKTLVEARRRKLGRIAKAQHILDEEIARGDVRVITLQEAHAVYGAPLPKKVIDPDFKYDESAYLRAFMEWSNSADNAPMPTKEDFKV